MAGFIKFEGNDIARGYPISTKLKSGDSKNCINKQFVLYLLLSTDTFTT